MFVDLPINKMAFVMKTTIFSMSCKKKKKKTFLYRFDYVTFSNFNNTMIYI
jgi:hypothetical protein